MVDLFGLIYQGKTIIDSFYVNSIRVNFHFFDRATFLVSFLVSGIRNGHEF